MSFLIIIFFLSLLLGQFGGIQLSPGITVFIHDVLAGFLLLFFLLRRLQQKKEIKGELLRPLLYFTGVAGVSLLLNIGGFSYVQLMLGSFYLWRFLLYAGLYVVVRNETFSPAKWLIGLYSTGVGIALLGFLQYVFYPSLRNMLSRGWDEHYYRLFSTLLDPNFTGLFLVVSFFLGLYLYSEKWKGVLISTQLMIGIAILLTYSRSSFLAFGVGLLVFVILTKRTILLICLVFGALIYAGLPSHGIDANRLFRSDSTMARIHSYSEAIPRVTMSPIIGIGYNMLRYQSGREKILDADGITSRDAAGLNSSLLVVLVTTGIVGFCFFLYLLYTITKILLFRKDTLSFVGISAFVAIIVHSLFNNSFFYSWMLIWLWIAIGSIEQLNGNSKVSKKLKK